MKTKHTPSPWHATELDDPRYSHEISGPNVHMGFLPVWPIAADEMRANARLIAAAPDLLAALETLLPHVLHYAAMPSASSEAHQHAATARAAIAKAKGEA